MRIMETWVIRLKKTTKRRFLVLKKKKWKETFRQKISFQKITIDKRIIAEIIIAKIILLVNAFF